MAVLDPRVVEFIHEHYVLTLATSFEEEPYCTSCFFSFLDEENSFVVLSDKDTRHIRDASHNIFVAGTIHNEAISFDQVRGVQYQGILIEPTGELFQKARKAYLTKFPTAVISKSTLWLIDLTFVKMTDIKLGNGKKILWKKL